MLWIIWLIFALLFLSLAYYHWRVSNKKIPPFQISTRPYKRTDSPIQVTIKMAGADIDEPLEEFISDFNSYLDNYNKSSHRQNRIQACGYLFASLTAVFSMFLTW